MRIGTFESSLLATIVLIGLQSSASYATPVTGWQVDPLASNTTPGLTGANTNSPVWGSGADGSTNNSAIFASFPTISITGDRTLTLSATVELVGSDATHEQFRFGLLNSNGSSTTSGWLGFLGMNGTGTQAGDLSAKNPLGENFAASSWASILGNPPRAVSLGTAIDPEQDPFFAGTYNVRLSIRRAGDNLILGGAISGTTYSQVWESLAEVDPARLTFDFNRVGFFAGAALAAEQINITNVDVSLITAGDTNGDDLVDLVDYQAIISHMNLTNQTLANGDLTGDGKVTIADYRVWKSRRSDLSGPGEASIGVPEPTSIALVLVGLVSLIAGRMRRR
jgi:Dockerin type I domain